MSSVFPYIPSIGALMGYGMRTLAQSASTAHTPSPSDAPATQADIVFFPDDAAVVFQPHRCKPGADKTMVLRNVDQ